MMVPLFCPLFSTPWAICESEQNAGGPQSHESPLGPSPLEIPWWKLPLGIFSPLG